ncbi:hypothetical protein FQA47_010584 [Oryzias melastigma]|uniref:Uncharacterized protein n=1 Tax=Oryzias melastigma TaxID=30732 RepID=A0A834CHQ8_ORYME|nr:hypothetical protein FQA47_010584 [Oryzias melastigma]
MIRPLKETRVLSGTGVHVCRWRAPPEAVGSGVSWLRSFRARERKHAEDLSPGFGRVRARTPRALSRISPRRTPPRGAETAPAFLNASFVISLLTGADADERRRGWAVEEEEEEEERTSLLADAEELRENKQKLLASRHQGNVLIRSGVPLRKTWNDPAQLAVKENDHPPKHK